MEAELIRWVGGVLFATTLGSYGYAYKVGNDANITQRQMESRIERQMDIIEKKVDTVLERQYNERHIGR